MLWRALAVDVNRQGFEKRSGGRQLDGDLLDVLWNPVDGHGFESIEDVRDDLEEGIVGGQAVVSLQPHIDGGSLRAIKVDESLVDVGAIDIGPQSRARCENISPSPAHMSQCDRGPVPDVLVPEVRDEDEDLWRDAVDWGEPVIPGPDQAEDLEGILLESLDLRERTDE